MSSCNTRNATATAWAFTIIVKDSQFTGYVRACFKAARFGWVALKTTPLTFNPWLAMLSQCLFFLDLAGCGHVTFYWKRPVSRPVWTMVYRRFKLLQEANCSHFQQSDQAVRNILRWETVWRLPGRWLACLRMYWPCDLCCTRHLLMAPFSVLAESGST